MKPSDKCSYTGPQCKNILDSNIQSLLIQESSISTFGDLFNLMKLQTPTTDGYIHKVKQVAALLDYGEPQIMELFKNTLPSRSKCHDRDSQKNNDKRKDR